MIVRVRGLGKMVRGQKEERLSGCGVGNRMSW